MEDVKETNIVRYQRGTIVGIISLTRLLPDTYEDMCCCSFLVAWYPDVVVVDDDEDEGAILPELSKETSDKLISVSGNKAIMSSNSLTTSIIDGLSSGWSWQQLRARVKNLSKHSDGYKPILLSIMVSIEPDW